MPRPAATGMAIASSPIRINRVTISMSAGALAILAILEVAYLVRDLLLGGTRADQLGHAAQVAQGGEPQRGGQQEQADGQKGPEADDPECLRNHRRRFERRLAARSGGPGLRQH